MKKDKEELLESEEQLQVEETAEEPQQPEDTEEKEKADERNGQEHHHHHHSHHSHHHKHRHSKKRSSGGLSVRKIKKFFKKHKKIFIPVGVMLGVALIMVGLLGVVELISGSKTDGELTQVQGTDGIVIMATPVFTEEISLVNSAVDTILENQDYDAPAHTILENYLETSARLDIGLPVKLNFHISNKPADYTLEKYRVEVADNPQFENPWEYTVDAGAQSLELFNLKTGTQYHFRIHAHFTNGVVSTSGSTFRTKASPRILNVAGVYNARDIGGWKTADGKTVQQGLLYRGTELDGAEVSQYTLTEEGRTDLLERLGVRTEMDLRWEALKPGSKPVLGENVNYCYYSIAMYTDIFVSENQEEVRQVFSDLAKPELYPVYMHCTYGRDRTGTICCLLEALLGVSEEDLWRDYQLSALDEKYLDSSFGRLISQLKGQPGDTLSEKAENYLLSLGVTAAEIASIREIYLG